MYLLRRFGTLTTASVTLAVCQWSSGAAAGALLWWLGRWAIPAGSDTLPHVVKIDVPNRSESFVDNAMSKSALGAQGTDWSVLAAVADVREEGGTGLIVQLAKVGQRAAAGPVYSI